MRWEDPPALIRSASLPPLMPLLHRQSIADIRTQGGIVLDDKAAFLLMRHAIVVGYEPAQSGAMATSGSAMDPLFTVLHPLFGKALHVLWMSPSHRDNYDFTWELSNRGGGEDGRGKGLWDDMPFSGEKEKSSVTSSYTHPWHV